MLRRSYTLTGANSPLRRSVQLTKSKTSLDVALDFRDELSRAVKAVLPSDPFSLRKCVRLACADANSKLAAWKAIGGFEAYPERPSDPGVIAEAFFVGYYKNHPSFVHAKFTHENHVLIPVDPKEETLYIGTMGGYGSAEIINRFNDPGEQLLRGYRDNIEPDERRLENAIELAKNYFKASADPDIQKLDEKQCASVSATFHVATITQKYGFKWLIGPDKEL